MLESGSNACVSDTGHVVSLDHSTALLTVHTLALSTTPCVNERRRRQRLLNEQQTAADRCVRTRDFLC